MARTVTLLQLRTAARLYADERPATTTGFITDAELTAIVNAELCALYDLLVQARGATYYVKQQVANFTPGTGSYAWPSDFYEVFQLQINWGTRNIETIPRMTQLDGTALYNGATWGQWGPKCYVIGGLTGFVVAPIPATATQYLLYYVPTCTALSADGDTFDGINGWDELVALMAAVKMRVLQDAPSEELAALASAARQRIAEMANDRDVLHAEYVQDVAPEQMWNAPWGRLPRP